MTMLSPSSHTHLKLRQAVLLLQQQYSCDAGKEWAACNIHAPLPTTAAAAASVIPCNSMSRK